MPAAGTYYATTPPEATAPAIDDDSAPPHSECKSAYGKTACGYHCTEGYGVVRCAQTAAGSCRAEYGEVTCWDPPMRRHGGHHGHHHVADGTEAAPPSTCKSAYGMTACGYHCVDGYGVVRCAQTPRGSCCAEYGEVTCWDPGH